MPVRAQTRTRTRNLRLAVAGSALLLAACTSGSEDAAVRSGLPSPAQPPSPPQPPAPEPAPSVPTSVPSPSPAAGEGNGLVLGGANLGVTMLGAPFEQAVAAVTSVLGAPTENPAKGVTCIQATKEVQWEGFRLAAGEGGVAAGWAASSLTLQTPSGVAVGTDLATLQRIYGAALKTFPPNTDNPDRSFQVEGVDLFGGLDDQDTVSSLYSSFCSGP